ncbi:hypothetical protein AB1287_17145 [Enterobacter asburiae]|uniref:hypothetical protein n=1 Tax=Scandinavium sp. UTDF21-P1B TaxID=3446379 RepID=UPI00346E4D4E
MEFAGHNSGDSDITPPDNGGGDAHSVPVINLLQDHIVVQKQTYNAGYAINASATTNAEMFKWEVVEGYGNFQLQEKQATPTHNKLEGKNLNTERSFLISYSSFL